MKGCTGYWITVEDAAAVRSDVDTAVDAGIARDLQNESPLVLIVVDARPGMGFVDRTEDSWLSVDGSDEVERRVVVTGRRFAEAEGLDRSDSRQTRESDFATGVWWDG